MNTFLRYCVILDGSYRFFPNSFPQKTFMNPPFNLSVTIELAEKDQDLEGLAAFIYENTPLDVTVGIGRKDHLGIEFAPMMASSFEEAASVALDSIRAIWPINQDIMTVRRQ